MRVVEQVVADLLLDAETKAHALATAREKALTLNTAREVNLIAAAEEVERWTEKLSWRGSGTGERRAETIVEVDYGLQLVPVAPRFPSTAGVTVTVVSVERWDDTAEAFTAADYSIKPGGRIRLVSIGTFKIVADLLPPAAPPALAMEAAARLWAYRELLRPVAGSDGLAGSGSLSAAMYRSGASGILRSLKLTGRS